MKIKKMTMVGFKKSYLGEKIKLVILTTKGRKRLLNVLNRIKLDTN